MCYDQELAWLYRQIFFIDAILGVRETFYFDYYYSVLLQ